MKTKLSVLSIHLILFVLSAAVLVGSRRVNPASPTAFIIVDPLDEYNHVQEAKRVINDLGLRYVPLISRSIARVLGAQLSDDDENQLSTRDIGPEDLNDKEQCLEWLRERDIAVEDIAGVLCETDTGLRTAELLAATLDLPSSNGVNEARRDKYMMQQALAEAGLLHIRQVLTENWTEVDAFIKNTGFPIVIKPCRGSASRNVSKCENLESAQKSFELLLGYPGYANGTISDAVLVQEYISGHEYVVDTVSSNGEHKIVAIWKYDKRELSGAPFVYYCTELVTETNDCISDSLIEYSIKVLDALGVKYGPAHIEIKIDAPIDDQVINGPLLIEANIGRWHGQDIVTICDMALGYNAVDATIHAYLHQHTNRKECHENSHTGRGSVSHLHHHALSRWLDFPMRPRPARYGAKIVHLSSDKPTGTVKALPDEDVLSRIRSLPSFLRYESFYEDASQGDDIKQTIDLSSATGYALLINEDLEVLRNDYDTLLELQKEIFHS